MRSSQPKLLKLASLLLLVSLAMIVFGVLYPRPLAVIAAMSIGQGIGTLGALLFFVLIFRDIKPVLRNRAKPAEEAPSSKAEPPSKAESEPPPAP